MSLLCHDVPPAIFNIDVRAVIEGTYSYQVATPEKRYAISSKQNIQELKEVLFEDLRIDEGRFYGVDKAPLLELAPSIILKTSFFYPNL